MEHIDNFLGLWTLDAEATQYELGEPPQSGTYEIQAEDHTLTFNMEWVDAAGEFMQMSYSEVCDGEWHDYPVKQLADQICLTLKSPALLTSESMKDGALVLSATRELTSKQRMKVTMSGIKPDGSAYHNIAWYDKTSASA